jgi:5-(carboxyamino)imidazole ribonucleotide mutase
MMPPGIPVATVAVDGAVNAALLACQIIAVGDGELAKRLDDKRVSNREKLEEKSKKIKAELGLE